MRPSAWITSWTAQCRSLSSHVYGLLSREGQFRARLNAFQIECGGLDARDLISIAEVYVQAAGIGYIIPALAINARWIPVLLLYGRGVKTNEPRRHSILCRRDHYQLSWRERFHSIRSDFRNCGHHDLRVRQKRRARVNDCP